MKKATINLKVITLFFLFFSQFSFATSYTWNGATSTAWNTTTNWTPNGTPGSGDGITITSSGTYQPLLSGNITINRIIISSGTLGLGGYTLTCSSTNSTFSGGTISNGTLVLRGAVNVFSGTTFSVTIDAIVNEIDFDGGTFNNYCYFETTTMVPGSGNGGCTFNDSVYFYHNYTGSGIWRLNTSTGNRFNNKVTFKNKSTAEITTAGAGINVFNGDIVLENTGTGGILLGNDTLTAGHTISIGPAGYTTGDFQAAHFYQAGTTAISLTFTGNALPSLDDATFGGNFSITSNILLFKYCTFKGTASFTATGSSSSAWRGGNLFYGNVTITNNATGGALTLDADTANTYYANATFNGSRSLRSETSSYHGNITSASNATFSTGSGIARFYGSNDQTVSATNGFAKIKMYKSAGNVILSSAHSVTDAITFYKGNIKTTSSNLLSITSTGSVTGASDSSFIDGPVKKTGNTAFVFPVGKKGSYRPIEMSAPSTSTNAYTAEFFDDTTAVNSLQQDTSIGYVFRNKYWKLSRNSGTSQVYVTLNWNPSMGIIDTTLLLATGWDGTKWKNLGKSNLTGNNANGSLKTTAVATSYNEFSLCYSKTLTATFSCDSSSLAYNASPSKIFSYNFDAVAGSYQGVQYPCSLTAATYGMAGPQLFDPNSSLPYSSSSPLVGTKYLTVDSTATHCITGPSFNLSVSGNEVFCAEFIFKLDKAFSSSQTLRFFEIGRKNHFTFSMKYPDMSFITCVDDSSYTTNDYLRNDAFTIALTGSGRKNWSYYTDGNWHHIFLRYDARSATKKKEIWIDGLLETGFYRKDTTGYSMSTLIGTWKNFPGGNQIKLLGGTTSSDKFVGSMDELAFYNDNLCEQQIVQHYEDAILNVSHYCFDSSTSGCSFNKNIVINTVGLNSYDMNSNRLKQKITSATFNVTDTTGFRKTLADEKPLLSQTKCIAVKLFYNGTTDTTSLKFNYNRFAQISDVKVVEGGVDKTLGQNYYSAIPGELVLLDEFHSIEEQFMVPVYVNLYNGLVMSPDSDGVYDTFQILGLTDTAGFSLTIYDRYQQQIFQTYNIASAGWNGNNSSSQRVPIGTYSYEITLQNKKVQGQFLIEY